MEASRQIDPRQRADLLLRDLRKSRSGLSGREAERRLIQYGPNEIRRREGAGHVEGQRTTIPSASSRRLSSAPVICLRAPVRLIRWPRGNEDESVVWPRARNRRGPQS